MICLNSGFHNSPHDSESIHIHNKTTTTKICCAGKHNCAYCGVRNECTEGPYPTICNPRGIKSCWGIVVFHLFSQHQQFVQEVEKCECDETTTVTTYFLNFHRRVNNMKYSVANKKVFNHITFP